MTANGEHGPVLLVDDDEALRETLHEVFRASGYRCRLAANGREALEVFEAERPMLTVTDMEMPVMDGLGILRRARALDGDAIVVDPDALLSTARRGLEHRRSLLGRRAQQAFLERRAAETARELQRTVRHLRDTYRSTLEALGSAIETRDAGTQAHSRRVHGYSLALARAHGVPESDLRDIEHGVLLHDIGKIGIPDAILLKPGPLTPAEWAVMRRHPEIGRQMIEKIPFLRGAVPIVLHHHERWDGTGYPLGLRGKSIPLAARIFAVVDAFDAMTFDRPYSSAMSFEAARRGIRRGIGTQFDPAVVETFLGIPPECLVAAQRGDASVELVPDETEAVVLAISGRGRGLRLVDGEAAIGWGR